MQQILFIHHWVDWPFGYDFDFLHLFHCVDFVAWFLSHLPNLTKSSFSNNKIQSKRVETYFVKLLFIVILSVIFKHCAPFSFGGQIAIVLDLSTWPCIPEAIKVNMSKIRSKIQKVANKNLFLFVLGRRAYSKTIFPKGLLICFRLDLGISGSSDIVGKNWWFEVEIKLNSLNDAVVVGLSAFKQNWGFLPRLPYLSNALNRHDNFM